MTLPNYIVNVDLKGILSDDSLQDLRLSTVFSHHFSDSRCYFAIAHKDSVILVLYGCSFYLISMIPSYDTVVLEFPVNSGTVCCLHWLKSILLIGFDTGYMMIFSDEGSCLFESKYFDSPVVNIRAIEKNEGLHEVWIMFESGYLSALFVRLISNNTNDMYAVSVDDVQVGQVIKYKLIDHSSTNDFIILQKSTISHDYKMIVDTKDNSPSISICVGGSHASISLYNLGCPQQFQHFGKLANYVKEKVVHVFSKTVMSFFDAIKTPNSSDPNPTINSAKEYDQAVASMLDISDPKRKVLRMIIDYHCDLIALVDNLGRVLLFDLKLHCVIRIWKGVRDARIAWCDDSSKQHVNRGYSLGLAIYAPQTGLLSIYAMRHGPCLKSIPIGLQCHIFSDTISSDTANKNSCFVVSFANGSIVIKSITQYDGFTVSPSHDLYNIRGSRQRNKSKAYSMDLGISTIPPNEGSPLLDIMTTVLSMNSVEISALSKDFWSQLESKITIALHADDVDSAFFLDVFKSIRQLELKAYSAAIPSSSNEEFRGFSLELHSALISKLKSIESFSSDSHDILRSQIDAFAVFRSIFDQRSRFRTPIEELSLNLNDVSNGGSMRIETLAWALNDSSFKDLSLMAYISERKQVLKQWENSIDCDNLNFTLFSLFFDCDGKTGSLLHSNVFLNTSTQSLAQLQCNIDMSGSRDLISRFITLSLTLDDTFLLASFQKALSLIFRSSFDSISFVLQALCWQFTSFSDEVAAILILRVKSSSIFHKWLRDALLALQVTVSSLTNAIATSISNIDSGIDPNCIESLISEDKNSQLELQSTFRAMLHANGDSAVFDSDGMFDKVVSMAMDGVQKIVLGSSNIFGMMCFASVVFDSLSSVKDQLERRTYNACSLKRSIRGWKEIFAQLRIVNLVKKELESYHGSSSAISILSLENGNVSIYEALAIDSLKFSKSAEDCKQHESRCRDIIRRISVDPIERSPLRDLSANNGNNINDASDDSWHSSFDLKWKDLVSIGAFIESDIKLTNKAKSKVDSPMKNDSDAPRKRRPLLLYFSSHNSDKYLSCRRTLLIASRWNASPHDVDLLARLLDHLSSIALSKYQEQVAIEIQEKFLIPLLHFICRIDENPSALGDSPPHLAHFMSMIASPPLAVEWSNLCLQIIHTPQLKPVDLADDSYEQDSLTNVWPPYKDKFIENIESEHVAQALNLLRLKNEAAALLYSIQLRAYCRLRHCPLSLIIDNCWFETTQSRSSHESSKDNARIDFISSCFRFILPSPDVRVIFQLSNLWKIEQDVILLLELSIVFDKSNADHIVGDIIAKIDDTKKAVDVMISGIRKRLCFLIINLDRIPKYGPFISTLDSEITAWVRGCSAVNKFETKSEDPLKRGSLGTTSFDIKSTKHLVLLMQSLTLSQKANVKNDSAWLDNKLKIEGILELCENIESLCG